MSKKYVYLFLLLAIFIVDKNVLAKDSLSSKLKGRILLQVQGRGEAWYVDPSDNTRYYLGRPLDAFNIMRSFGLGVKHNIITRTKVYPERLLGKILIDVEDKGKAYYINPVDRKAYYLGRPDDAFRVMRTMGLGITNSNLEKIQVGTQKNNEPKSTQNTSNDQKNNQPAQNTGNKPGSQPTPIVNKPEIPNPPAPNPPAPNPPAPNPPAPNPPIKPNPVPATNPAPTTPTPTSTPAIPTPPPSLINPSASTTPINVKNLEQEVYYLINLTRTAMYLPQLKQNEKLTQAARDHVQDMISNNYYNYSRPGVKFNDFVDKTVGFFGYKSVAEIISDKNTSSNILQSIIDDPDSKSKILGNYTEIGVGIMQDKNGKVITSVYLMTPK